jgi:hypothetical protein|tara:strand:+ start:2328 stop:2711 length:384 start_codon:yes stop_codon:yes gene_type:complete
MRLQLKKNMDDEEEHMPFVFRITEPIARRKIRVLGFDRRRRESRIYEYAIQRYYMDLIGVIIALIIILTRIYLAFDFGQPMSGSIPLNESDAIIFLLSISTLMKNWTLIRDYQKNVITRIEAVAKSK